MGYLTARGIFPDEKTETIDLETVVHHMPDQKHGLLSLPHLGFFSLLSGEGCGVHKW